MIRLGLAILILGLVGGGVATARQRAPLFQKREIEDPAGKGLGRVLRQLSCLAARKHPRIVRIAHYGDSIVVDDRLSSAMRQLLQGRFGDAGPGFLLIRAPSGSYRRAGVALWPNKYWKRSSVLKRWPPGGRFGYGGVINWSLALGSRLYLTPRKEGNVGGRVSRLVVHYEQGPRAGWVRLRRGRRVLGRFSTRGDVKRAATKAISFPETAGKLVFEHGGGGVVRLWGVALERQGPGVVVDGLGMVSGSYHKLARIADKHWRGQLKQRGVGLVIFQFGANASDIKRINERWYKRTVKRVLARLKTTRPRVSCLVVGPVDRGYSWYRSKRSRPVMRRISAWQRQVALANGCAFFDSLAAQGGRGAARRWHRARPSLLWRDLTHLTPAGAKVVGQLVGRALLRAYDRYRKKHGRASCPATARPRRRP